MKLEQPTMGEKIKADMTNILRVYLDDPDPNLIELYTGFIINTIKEHDRSRRISMISVGFLIIVVSLFVTVIMINHIL